MMSDEDVNGVVSSSAEDEEEDQDENEEAGGEEIEEEGGEDDEEENIADGADEDSGGHDEGDEGEGDDEGDEEEGDIDGDNEEGDDDEEEDEDDDDNDQEELQVVCARLRDNNTNNSITASDSFTVQICNDDEARQLAEALTGNQTLLKLGLILWSESLSLEGAQALAKGLSTSAVCRLSLYEGQDLEEDYPGDRPTTVLLQHVYPESVLRRLCELNIHYDVRDDDLERMGTVLQNGNSQLNELLLRMSPSVTQHGAHGLSQGLASSTISKLSLENASPTVCRILWARGLLTGQPPTLSCFSITNDDTIDPDDKDTDKDGETPVSNSMSTSSSQLETLLFQSCVVEERDMQLLTAAVSANASHLQQLSFHDVPLGDDDGIQFLHQLVEAATQLQEFSLSSHGLNGAGIERIMHAVAKHESLKTMTLSCEDAMDISNEDYTCRLEDPTPYDGIRLAPDLYDSSAAALVRCLGSRTTVSSWSSLRELNVTFHHLGLAGVHQLVRVSASCPFLKELIVQNYFGIRYEGLLWIANELAHSKLRTLSLEVRGIDHDESHVELATAQQKAREAAALALVRAMKVNTYLQGLSVDLMNLPEHATNEIEFYLELNKAGRQLLRQDDDHGQESVVPLGLWSLVMAKCSDDASALFYYLQQQPTLVQLVLNDNIAGKKRARSNPSTSTAIRKKTI